MQLIDPDHPFYRPLWVRVAIVAVCLGWAIIEVSTAEPFWAIIVGALGIYSAYKLLVTYSPPPLKEEAEASASASEAEAPTDETGGPTDETGKPEKDPE